MLNNTTKSLKNHLVTLSKLGLIIGLMTSAACQSFNARLLTHAQPLTLTQNKTDLLAGHFKAIAYSGYRRGQHPDQGNGAIHPNDEQILEDLNLLTKDLGFAMIRLYDSGEKSTNILRLIKKHKIKIKVMLGAWLNAEISNHEGSSWLEPIPQTELNNNTIKNQQEIQKTIRLANQYKDIIVAVNIGNEALVAWTDHLVSVESVIAYVKQVKQVISQPVTVAENYDWWAKHGVNLAKELDFIAIHTYPIWEDRDIDKGMSYTIANLKAVKKTLPNSRLLIAEAGWASTASEFGQRASEKKQQQYYIELLNFAKDNHITTFWFEAFDETWKGNPNNANGAEKHWGLLTVDRTDKQIALLLRKQNKEANK